PEARAFFEWTRARTAIAHGLPQTAERAAREAVLLFRQLGRPNFAGFAAIPLAMGLALTRQPDQAADTLRDDSLAGDHSFWNGTDRMIALGWIHVARGDLHSAREELDDAATYGAGIGDNIGAAAALHDLVRLGGAKQYADPLAEIGKHIEGDLTATQIRHA